MGEEKTPIITPERKIEIARSLLFEATKELKVINSKKVSNEKCRCGHKRKDHSVAYSINYTGGFCSKCKCMNFLNK